MTSVEKNESIGRIEKVKLYPDQSFVFILEAWTGALHLAGFDKIEDYKGEYPKELKRFGSKGLRKGVLVKFKLDKRGKVFSIRPLVF